MSCGVAMFPEHGRDATSLLRAADVALFRAKELGRNRLCVHDPSMLVEASNRFRVEQALRKAIEGGDLVLHYQPQVCLGRRRTTAVEALLRWKRSDNQIVAAGEFIEIAEQSGPDARPERLDPRDGGRSGEPAGGATAGPTRAWRSTCRRSSS